MQVDVCPGDDFWTFYPSEGDGKNVFDDPNSFRRTQLSQTSNLSRSLVRLMKSSEFGLGHLIRDLKRSLIIYLTPLHATPELALRPEFEKPQSFHIEKFLV